MDDRLIREQEFHDARFAAGADTRSADRFYAINRASDTYFRARIDAMPMGSAVLDYGCGEGAYAALHAADRGLHVTAIDLSPIAVERAADSARAAGLAAQIDFRVMNAEHLDLADDSFDFICGLGVLHHLKIGPAMAEITRVLRTGGEAVFVEPLGHNPAINLYRSRTPEQRTEDEHPLCVDELALITSYFGRSELSYFHLFGLLALPLVGTRLLAPAVRTLDRLDQRAFRRLPRLQRHAWMVGMRLAGPMR